MSDTTNLNKAYFNKIAAEYDKRFEKTTERLSQEVEANKQWIGMKHGGRLLDYASGTGFLSRTIGADASECVGIDLSENMIGAYNTKVEDQAFPQNNCKAYLGNLLDPSNPSPAELSDAKFFNFDLAGVGVGFHHFDDPSLAVKQLSERLRPGGVLFIMDFMSHKDDSHSPHGLRHTHGVMHNGFSEEQMKKMFEEGGVGGEFGFKELAEPLVLHNAMGEGQHLTRNVFFARGTKV